MNNFEWILTWCFFIFILILSGEIAIIPGLSVIGMILIIYYLYSNDYFGGNRR